MEHSLNCLPWTSPLGPCLSRPHSRAACLFSVVTEVIQVRMAASLKLKFFWSMISHEPLCLFHASSIRQWGGGSLVSPHIRHPSLAREQPLVLFHKLHSNTTLTLSLLFYSKWTFLFLPLSKSPLLAFFSMSMPATQWSYVRQLSFSGIIP